MIMYLVVRIFIVFIIQIYVVTKWLHVNWSRYMHKHKKCVISLLYNSHKPRFSYWRSYNKNKKAFNFRLFLCQKHYNPLRYYILVIKYI